MYQDELAFNQGYNLYLTWMRHLAKNSTESLAAKLAAKHRRGLVTKSTSFAKGSFNHCYRVKFEEGPDAIVRFPAMGRVSFRREKVENEASVMRFIAQHTSIPIPQVLGSGTCAVGPYLVMEFVEGKLLSEYLTIPAAGTDVDILDPKINDQILKKAYSQMAQILLELSKCQFSNIGSITQDEHGTWSVRKRALTFNMNELVSLGNYPPKESSTGPFSAAADYFESLAKEHMRHLWFQRNDAIDDEADCRKKYIARCLFLKIARTFSTTHNNGPFRLFCDDLRPANVIVDGDLNIRGIIDLDFSYAAPVEFTHSPPWWLLLALPDGWEDGLDDFLAIYLPRLETFLEVMRECENQAIQSGTLLESQRLSGHMEQSMHSGDFWVCFAARSSFAFDDIYWRFIDPRYYGEFTSIEERLKLLSAEERNELKEFTSLKMQQAEIRKLDEHWTLDEMLAA